MKKFCWVWIAVLFVGCDEPARESESKDDVRRRCGQARARLVEERLEGVTLDRDQHRRALTDALGEKFIASCVEQRAAEEK